MPEYHVVACCEALSGGGSQVTASIRPGWNQSYRSSKPAMAFDLPFDDLSMVSGFSHESYDELLARLSAGSGVWWCARIYSNYERTLDAYIKFSEDASATHHYILDCPGFLIDGESDYAGEKFPQPKYWYYCTKKVWVHRYTDEDFEAMWAAMGASTTGADTMGDAGTVTGDASGATMTGADR